MFFLTEIKFLYLLSILYLAVNKTMNVNIDFDITQIKELNKIVPAWKKETTPIVSDSILSGLKESEMSQKKLIKVRTFPGAAIQNMRLFVVQLLRKSHIELLFTLELISPPL